MSSKTLATKILDSRGIWYQVHSYPEGERDANLIAKILDIPGERVFKTLVAVRSLGKPLLVMVPASHQLDLKKLARQIGEKKVKLATHRQAEQMTGLKVGGISPLALLNKGFVNLLDSSATKYKTVCISAGKKGLNLEINVADLKEVLDAVLVDVIS
jgi:Cys-tRNA(Pro)/Cys-tRNA(Cys) deacylase